MLVLLTDATLQCFVFSHPISFCLLPQKTGQLKTKVAKKVFLLLFGWLDDLWTMTMMNVDGHFLFQFCAIHQRNDVSSLEEPGILTDLLSNNNNKIHAISFLGFSVHILVYYPVWPNSRRVSELCSNIFHQRCQIVENFVTTSEMLLKFASGHVSSRYVFFKFLNCFVENLWIDEKF